MKTDPLSLLINENNMRLIVTGRKISKNKDFRKMKDCEGII